VERKRDASILKTANTSAETRTAKGRGLNLIGRKVNGNGSEVVAEVHAIYGRGNTGQYELTHFLFLHYHSA
jgi:hypothetical protein